MNAEKNLKTVTLTVNGKAVTRTVEPRTSLADFVRHDLMLTGTHLGCEHGVCGACTVLIDGQPMRSCITYAVACDGMDVTTIEGFEADPTMRDLRDAFAAEHALQCGYCTPGMLVAARDIVLRLPGADEARIRKELSGNLCRCTGYVGIVNAVMRAMKAAPARPVTQPTPKPAVTAPAPRATMTAPVAKLEPAPTAPRASHANRIEQSFTVHHPRDAVWAFFADVDAVAACMPGAQLTAPSDGRRVEGRITVKMGPMAPSFKGVAEIWRDDAAFRGTIEGQGLDEKSASRTRGEVAYALSEIDGGTATRVDIAVEFTLTGALAQFSRGGLVNELAARIVEIFAKNLEARMDARARGEDAPAGPAAGAELNAFAIFWSALKGWLKGLFGGK